MIDDEDDARLVALIEGRLDAAARQALETRLMVEPELRARYHDLAAGGLPFAAAFEAVLAEAPLARMQAKLGSLGGDVSRARPRQRWIAAVAAAIVLLFVGWGVGRFAPEPFRPETSEEHEDWRQAVAGYASLYTIETFAGIDGEAAELAQLSKSLGVALTPAAIALPDMTFKWAGMLAFNGAPLGEIAYLDGATPVVFCIISNGAEEAPIKVENFEGVAIASWARGGRGFLVGGRVSKERATQLAGTLAARF